MGLNSLNMLSGNGIGDAQPTLRLITLGRLMLAPLADDRVDSATVEALGALNKQRRKLGVLVVLALSARPLHREALVEMFWGDQEEGRARHSLTEALSHLRRVLGREAIATRVADVSLSPRAHLSTDAAELAAAVRAEAYDRALSLYEGPFLDGFSLANAPAFEHWADRERAGLEALFVTAAGRQCHLLARARRWPECASTAARWLERIPLSADAALFRLNSLKAEGTFEAAQCALAEFEALRVRLSREFEAEPDPSVVQLANDIAAHLPNRPDHEMPGVGRDVALAAAAETSRTPASQMALLTAQENGGARERSPRLAPRTRRFAIALSLIAVVALMVVSIRFGVQHVERSEQVGGVVVLPFTHLGGDSTSTYLTEGLTEDLTTALGGVDGLRVLATESVLPLRQQRLDARTIGRQLGVDAVLDGSIRTEGDRARITVRLVNVADGFQLWSGRFDRTTSNVLSVQEEIAGSIVAALRERLPGVVGTPRTRAPVDAETYDLFARGRYFENRSGEENLRKAMQYYEQALARDSSFAPAYAGLADVHLALFSWGRTYGETAPRARVLAERALQLDSTSGASHETLAQLLRYDWRWSEAEREYHRALAANPNDAPTLHALSHLYLATGQLDSSLVVSRRALDLDPLNPRIGMHLCVHYIAARQYEDALSTCRRGLELDPAFPDSHAKLAWVYHYQGREDAAMIEINREIALSGRHPEYELLSALIHASAGRTKVAREILREVDRRTPAARVPFATAAAVDLRLNDRAHALRRLEDAYTVHAVAVEALATEPEFDPIRQEPRFIELLRRIGVRSWIPTAASSGDARVKREMPLPD